MNATKTLGTTLITLIGAFALTACGASDPAPVTSEQQPATVTPADQPAGDQDGMAHKGEAKHEHAFPANVAAFHETMAPLWHAEQGEKRSKDTCAAVEKMIEQANTLKTDAVPEKAAAHADDYKASIDKLLAALDTLKAECASNTSKTSWDEAFHGVHEAFHGIVGLLGHEEHGAEGEHAHEGHEGMHEE